MNIYRVSLGARTLDIEGCDSPRQAVRVMLDLAEVNKWRVDCVICRKLSEKAA